MKINKLKLISDMFIDSTKRFDSVNGIIPANDAIKEVVETLESMKQILNTDSKEITD